MLTKKLNTYFKNKQFLQLHQLNSNKAHPKYYFYKAVYANVCNQPTESNKYLDIYEQAHPIIPNAIAFDFWTIRNDNYVKLFDYKNAYKSSQVVTINYQHQLKEKEELKDALNTELIWKSLKDAPPQTITPFNPTTIEIEYDAANLMNFEVEANQQKNNFVFDTGAGISSITESLAQQLNFEMMPYEPIKVQGFTGVENEVQMAIAKTLTIGAIEIYNAPFLVFKDEALTFANGAYKINGIIGFPIAKELGTLHVSGTQLKIQKGQSQENEEEEKNLFIELLHPIIMLQYQNKLLPFNFDTGAKTTVFSKVFYEEFGASLSEAGTINEKKHASAGGESISKVMTVKALAVQLGKQTITFPSVDIDMDNYHISGKELYGNIGQDFLKQYSAYTISFEHNYVALG